MPSLRCPCRRVRAPRRRATPPRSVLRRWQSLVSRLCSPLREGFIEGAETNMVGHALGAALHLLRLRSPCMPPPACHPCSQARHRRRAPPRQGGGQRRPRAHRAGAAEGGPACMSETALCSQLEERGALRAAPLPPVPRPPSLLVARLGRLPRSTPRSPGRRCVPGNAPLQHVGRTAAPRAGRPAAGQPLQWPQKPCILAAHLNPALLAALHPPLPRSFFSPRAPTHAKRRPPTWRPAWAAA